MLAPPFRPSTAQTKRRSVTMCPANSRQETGTVAQTITRVSEPLLSKWTLDFDEITIGTMPQYVARECMVADKLTETLHKILNY